MSELLGVPIAVINCEGCEINPQAQMLADEGKLLASGGQTLICNRKGCHREGITYIVVNNGRAIPAFVGVLIYVE